MTEAAVVSYARTPLAKSFRGSFNVTHGAKLGSAASRFVVVLVSGIDAAMNIDRAKIEQTLRDVFDVPNEG